MSQKTKKELVCSVTMKDIEEQPFCGSGPGGQNRNKNKTAIRLVHHPSGARAESQQYKSQLQNKRAALRKLSQSAEFQLWARRQASQHTMSEVELQRKVDESMREKNLRIECRADNGVWQDENTLGNR